jgi:hypothetical protein
MRRGLAVALILFLAVALRPAEVDVAEALPMQAATHEQVIGAASGDAEDMGALTPTGNGRLTIDDRVYAGKSLVRSVSDEAASCLTGQFRSVEDWSLQSPKMNGSHRSTVTIRSEQGTVTLVLRGQMEYPSASGTWEVQRATGGCAGLEGEGSYTATFPASTDATRFQLTFDGQART